MENSNEINTNSKVIARRDSGEIYSAVFIIIFVTSIYIFLHFYVTNFTANLKLNLIIGCIDVLAILYIVCYLIKYPKNLIIQDKNNLVIFKYKSQKKINVKEIKSISLYTYYDIESHRSSKYGNIEIILKNEEKFKIKHVDNIPIAREKIIKFKKDYIEENPDLLIDPPRNKKRKKKKERKPANSASAILASGRTELKSPISGLVVKLCVDSGSKVNKGDTILIYEAMKFEYAITCPIDGIITFKVIENETVETNQVLANIE